MPPMVREAWTGERLDDLTKHMDENFREVRAELRQQREGAAAEFTALRKEIAEVKNQGAKTDTKIDGLVRTVQIGFWLLGPFLVGLMGMIAAQV